jgi:hypothetical protein
MSLTLEAGRLISTTDMRLAKKLQQIVTLILQVLNRTKRTAERTTLKVIKKVYPDLILDYK